MLEPDVVEQIEKLLGTTADIVTLSDDGGIPSYLVVEQEDPSQRLITDDDSIQLSEKVPANAFREIGGRASDEWGFIDDEYNADLKGISGLRIYDRMRRSDPAIRSAMRILKTPVKGGTFFVVEGEDTKEGKEIAAFVEKALFNMEKGFSQFLHEALLMLEFGYYFFEKVWERREVNGEQRITLKKLAPRHPLRVHEWLFDKNSNPKRVRMSVDAGHGGIVEIPANKLVIVTYDEEDSNIFGISVLRSAYKPWYLKENAYRIDAIQKERHATGIPIVKLPMGVSAAQKEIAKELARNLRTNHSAFAALPNGWEVEFLKLDGRPVSALETADHHSAMIFLNILAQSVWMGTTSSSGNDATELMDLFYRSAQEVANIIVEAINKQIIPELVRYNWDTMKFPQLKVRQLGNTKEMRELSFVLRNLIGAQLVRLDDKTEAWIRDVIGAPPFDSATERPFDAPTSDDEPDDSDSEPPATGGTPRPPRMGSKQSKASNMRTKPSSKEGKDGSGTS